MELLVGAHTSTAGGVHNALYEGQRIGATTVQIFTSNQKQWRGRVFSEVELALWEKALDETGIQSVMSHDSYLINLGTPKPDLLEKSLKAFKEEIERCQVLNLSYMNFHPGVATTSTEEECLDQIVQSLLMMEEVTAKGNVRLLLETTAGQGTTVGYKFEHLGYIIERVKGQIPIGVCIDTCHIFAAGYDIRTADGWNNVLADFDASIGLEHLYAFHLNDSQKPLASKRDRHANLGEGEIGLPCFEFLMKDKRTQKLPKYLETPNGETRWSGEIKQLREMSLCESNT